MSKFTCLVLCVVAVNLNRVFAASSLDIDTMLFDCAADNDVSYDKLRVVLETKDVTIINPCFFGCFFRNIGFLNDKGEYVINTGLTFIENNMPRFYSHDYAIIKEITTQCESVGDKAVSDGEAGCERGAMLAACFMEQVKAHREKGTSLNPESELKAVVPEKLQYLTHCKIN